jgi:hypothetical protein
MQLASFFFGTSGKFPLFGLFFGGSALAFGDSRKGKICRRLAKKGEKYGFLSVTKWRRAQVDITKYPDHRSWARAHAVQ